MVCPLYGVYKYWHNNQMKPADKHIRMFPLQLQFLNNNNNRLIMIPNHTCMQIWNA